jgi:hypothetical protein
VFACRDHVTTCQVHKHKTNQAKKTSCDCNQQFYLKSEGASYIHCDWLSLAQIEERYRRPGVEKIKRYLKKREEVDEENLKMWGGEPFNPDYAEVEKIIASQMVASNARGKPIEKFLVKWKGFFNSSVIDRLADVCRIIVWGSDLGDSRRYQQRDENRGVYRE